MLVLAMVTTAIYAQPERRLPAYRRANEEAMVYAASENTHF